MYKELYEAWKREQEDSELERLPPDFYSKAAEYIGKLEEEGRMLDKRTVKARLLESEMRNVKRMVNELIQVRYRKLIKLAAEGEKTPADRLAAEEKKMCMGILPLAEAYQSFAEKISCGNTLEEVSVRQKKEKVVMRFLAKTPSIVGLDMKTYGPFEPEDVASLPAENCRIMVKKGLAKKIEV